MDYDIWYDLKVGFWDWGVAVTLSETGGSEIYSMYFDPCDYFNKARIGIDAYGAPAYFNDFKVEKFGRSPDVPTVPIPGAIWMLSSGFLILLKVKRKQKKVF